MVARGSDGERAARRQPDGPCISTQEPRGQVSKPGQAQMTLAGPDDAAVLSVVPRYVPGYARGAHSRHRWHT